MDRKHPAGVIAADGQQTGARSLDVEVLLDGQFTAGQSDRLACEAGRKDDRVVAVRGVDGVSQRAGSAVEVVQDRQRAERGPIPEKLKPRSEQVPARSAAGRLSGDNMPFSR